MSEIDKLKDGAIMIDATEPEKINMVSPGTRVKADLSSLPSHNESEEVGVEIKESLAKDILEGEGSMFSEYLKEKEEEMSERMARFEDEQKIAEEAAEKDELKAEDEEMEIGTESMFNASSLVDKEESVHKVIDNRPVQEKNLEVATIDITVPKESEVIIEAPVKEEEVEELIPIEETSSESDTGIVTEVENPDIDVEVETIAGQPIDDEEKSTVNTNMDQDETLKKLQGLITERIKPVSKKLDISSFTLVKKPTADIRVISQEAKARAAKWVLPNQKNVVIMREFTGSELEMLRSYSEDSSSLTMLSKKWKMIYDHIESPKPADYTTWLKSTPFADLDHYFFAVFIASYKGANFLPMDCNNTKCTDKTWLTEDMPILDMVKFETEEAKNEFTKLYTSEDQTTGKGLYCSEIIPLTENVAIGFKEPSAYSLFEIASLDDTFKEKHAAILQVAPYIDALYLLNTTEQTITPVGYEVFPNNASKTVKSKVKKFESVIATLNTDEFGLIKSYVRAVMERDSGMRYRYPSVTCPACGTKTEEALVSAEELVFTRYQLGALASTPLK